MINFKFMDLDDVSLQEYWKNLYCYRAESAHVFQAEIATRLISQTVRI